MVRSTILKGFKFCEINKLKVLMRLTNTKNYNSWGQSNAVDGVRLKDAQKHRLASQNEDCHSKKMFPGASSGTALVQKKSV